MQKKTQMNNALDGVIEVLLSSDNMRRQEAENYINQMPSTNFEEFIDALLLSMNSANAQVAQMAALLLKKKYLDEKDNLDKMTAVKLQQIAQSVQNAMSTDKKTIFLKRCCDILAKILIHLKCRKELLGLVSTLGANENVNIKLTVMYLIEIVCQFAFEDDSTLIENASALEQLFQKGLEDQNTEVRVASFKTLTIFLCEIQDENQVKKFSQVLGVLLNKSIELVKLDQESGKKALQSLGELMDVHPKFVKPILNDLLRIFSQIMETSALSTNLRIVAMQNVLSMCMNNEAWVRKNEYFRMKMPQVYMKMLTQMDGMTTEEWAAQLNEEAISQSDISMATEQHLGQILVYLGTKFLLPLFIGMITAGLSSQNQKDQHAGLVAMSILTEGSHSFFAKDLPNIVLLISPLTQNTQPRILNDVLTVLGYLSEEFAPEIQTNYGKMILQFIIKGLKHPIPKIQMRAVQCIQNYCAKLDENKEQVATLLPYMDAMLTQIMRIFEWAVTNNNLWMMEATLSTLSSLSYITPFDKYYGMFMPGLKKLTSMIGGDTQQQSMIRNKTVECIGYILTSIKDNQTLYATECQAIMWSLIEMESSLESDDPLHSAMFKVYAQVAEVLKQNFMMYAPKIMEWVLRAVSSTIDCKVVDQTQTAPEKKKAHNICKLKWDYKLDGGLKNIILNTDSLQQKMEGSNLLVAISKNMGTSFLPFVQKSIEVVTPLLSYKYCKQIRHQMIVMVGIMVSACTATEQKVAILNRTIPLLMEQLLKVINLKNSQDMGLVLEVLTQVMPFCPQQLLVALPTLLSSVLSVATQLVKEVEKEYTEKDMDEELQEQLDEQTEEIEQLYEHVEKIIGLAGNRPEYQQLKKGFPSDYEFEQA